MGTLYRYFLIIAACGSLLLGIQIPNFVNQYEMRLDAHLSEVKNNLQGYQDIADRLYDGSITTLISKHEQSDDQTFKQEAVDDKEKGGGRENEQQPCQAQQ